MNELLIENIDNVDAIVFGGNTIRAQEFLERNDLDYRLQEKVVDTIIPVSVIDETGLYQAVKEASRLLRETEIYAERQMWDGFMQDLMKGNPTATYGEKEVMDALVQGRIDTILIIEEDPRIDDLFDQIQQFGTEIMIFSPQTESGAQLKSFGGIAARLR